MVSINPITSQKPTTLSFLGDVSTFGFGITKRPTFLSA